MGWIHKENRGHATDMRAPLARSADLIVEELDGQVLVYDERTFEAHCLTPAAAEVWHACDGRTGRQQLVAQLKLDTATVERALDELEACGLLDGIHSPGVTRREVTARFAKAGAVAAAATPLIYSIVSPTAAAAQSITAECQAVNALAGHDCGSKCPPNSTVVCHCASIGNGMCCCCHGPGPPLITQPPDNSGICNGDNQHCCTSLAACSAAGGSPCS